MTAKNTRMQLRRLRRTLLGERRRATRRAERGPVMSASRRRARAAAGQVAANSSPGPTSCSSSSILVYVAIMAMRAQRTERELAALQRDVEAARQRDAGAESDA